MFISRVLESWKTSLSVFTKKELLTFIFTWIRAFKRSSLTFLTYFGWLVVLKLFLPYLLVKKYFPYADRMTRFGNILSYVLYMLLVFFAILSVRSSVMKKDLQYFIGYLNKFLGFAILFLASRGLIYVCGFAIFYGINMGIITAATFGIYEYLVAFFKIPLMVFIYLFFIDSPGILRNIFRSVLNAVSLVVRFLPVSLCLFFIPVFLNKLIMFMVVNLFGISATFAALIGFGFVIYLIEFFVLCGIFTYYLKIKHSNYSLFFKK